MRRASVLAAALALLVTPAIASGKGFHWSYRLKSDQIVAWGTGYGRTCSSTIFSDWKWHGTGTFKQAVSGTYNGHSVVVPKGSSMNLDWTESIRNDGQPHALNVTHVGGNFLKYIPSGDQAAFEAQVRRGLDALTVTYLVKQGKAYLQFGLAGLPAHPVQFAYRSGGC